MLERVERGDVVVVVEARLEERVGDRVVVVVEVEEEGAVDAAALRRGVVVVVVAEVVVVRRRVVVVVDGLPAGLPAGFTGGFSAGFVAGLAVVEVVGGTRSPGTGVGPSAAGSTPAEAPGGRAAGGMRSRRRAYCMMRENTGAATWPP